MTKAEARHQYLSLRSKFSDTYRRQASAALFAKIVALPSVKSAQTICCYVSYREEINTHPIIDWLIHQGKQVSIPKVVGPNLQLHTITGLDHCAPGFKGILEPADSDPTIHIDQVEVCLTLGVAYDSKGFRLGYGKGFTDRLLTGSHTLKVGLCFTDQLTDALPHESHDVPMDVIVSDTVILWPPKSQVSPVHFS